MYLSKVEVNKKSMACIIQCSTVCSSIEVIGGFMFIFSIFIILYDTKQSQVKKNHSTI